MKIVRAKDELRLQLAPARAAGQRIGLVPTMGFLHDGHLSLLRAARAECDVVVMSLFVNPIQFGAGEDLERYPRDEERDASLAAAAGVDLIFAPDAAGMFPDGFTTAVEVGPELTAVLDGDPSRRGPGHFHGVTTIVAKLFNAVGPDVAYFGQKDAQQVAVVRRMARDLDFPVEVVALPTVREPDGLAMSSRNVYLEAADRARATALSASLEEARRIVLDGGRLGEALDAGREVLRRAGIEPEYLEARDPERLTPLAELGEGGRALIAVAAEVGPARLIDNLIIDPAFDGSKPTRVRRRDAGGAGEGRS